MPALGHKSMVEIEGLNQPPRCAYYVCSENRSNFKPASNAEKWSEPGVENGGKIVAKWSGGGRCTGLPFALRVCSNHQAVQSLQRLLEVSAWKIQPAYWSELPNCGNWLFVRCRNFRCVSSRENPSFINIYCLLELNPRYETFYKFLCFNFLISEQ